MLHEVENLIGPLEGFLDRALARCAALNIDVSGYDLDHVCYRCETKEEYVSICKSLKSLGEIVVEGMIGGRPIATFVLNEPIRYKHYSIPCIEIPCPKPGRFYQRGLEHLEIAIYDKSRGSEYISEDIHDQAQVMAFAARYPHVEFDTRSAGKEVNCEVSIMVDENSSIKFHVRPLKEVCEYERDHALYAPVPAGYFDV